MHKLCYLVTVPCKKTGLFGVFLLNLDFEAQGRGSTFTLCHDHLKKAISLGKLQKVGLFCTGLNTYERNEKPNIQGIVIKIEEILLSL